MPKLPNQLWLSANPGTAATSHFQLSEFANDDGFALVHPDLLTALELLRFALSAHFKRPVAIRITNATRTPSDNHRLARSLGWSDQGGLVSRISRHLTAYGGIAADVIPYFPETSEPVPVHVVAAAARNFFDYVQADYPDGHVHLDQRLRAAAAAGVYP